MAAGFIAGFAVTGVQAIWKKCPGETDVGRFLESRHNAFY
jgi:hypothetical protein